MKHAIDANDRQVQRFKTKINGRYVCIDRDCIGWEWMVKIEEKVDVIGMGKKLGELDSE